MSEELPPPLRVRRDHTCRSLGLEGLDLCHMCDKCRHFQMKIDGLCGQRPGKSYKERCEKSWMIPKGMPDETNYKTLEKKNGKILHDNVSKRTECQIINFNCLELNYQLKISWLK